MDSPPDRLESFAAAAAHFDEGVETGVAQFGLAERADGEGVYLLLQRTLSPSDADRRLGHDTVHAEFGGQHRGGYGQIVRLRFDASSMTAELTEEGRREFGCEAVAVALSGVAVPSETLAAQASAVCGRYISVESH